MRTRRCRRTSSRPRWPRSAPVCSRPGARFSHSLRPHVAAVEPVTGDLVSREHGWDGPLEHAGEPAELAPEDQPPDTARARATESVADHDTETRDSQPALGARGGPGPWTAAKPGRGSRSRALTLATLAGHISTRRATPAMPTPNRLPVRWPRRTGGCATRRSRTFMGRSSTRHCGAGRSRPTSGSAGSASGLGVRLARLRRRRRPPFRRDRPQGRARRRRPRARLADRRSRPARAFPEHDEDLQATLADEHGCLVPARLQWLGRAGRRLRPARPAEGPRAALGALTALFGSYLGSYTGVLLACTAVPLWSRSRTILGPAFVATATATGAAATRLVLVASGLPHGHPTRRALGTIETAAMLTELSISAFGERRLGDAAKALDRGRPGVYFRTAKSLVALGLALRLVARRTGPREHELASVTYLAAGSALPLRLGLCRKGFRERRRGRGGGGTRPFSVPRGPWASMERACPVAPAFPVAAAQCGSPCVR